MRTRRRAGAASRRQEAIGRPSCRRAGTTTSSGWCQAGPAWRTAPHVRPGRRLRPARQREGLRWSPLDRREADGRALPTGRSPARRKAMHRRIRACSSLTRAGRTKEGGQQAARAWPDSTARPRGAGRRRSGPENTTPARGWRCDVWRARLGSNQRPLASEANTLSTELRAQRSLWYRVLGGGRPGVAAKHTATPSPDPPHAGVQRRPGATGPPLIIPKFCAADARHTSKHTLPQSRIEPHERHTTHAR